MERRRLPYMFTKKCSAAQVHQGLNKLMGIGPGSRKGPSIYSAPEWFSSDHGTMGPPTFSLKHEAATFGQQAMFLKGY